MFTEKEKHDGLVQFMEILESIDGIMSMANAVEKLSLEDFNPETWASLQVCMETNRSLLEMMRMMLIEGSKLMDNDAVLGHITSVITAE